ncbi:MAG: 3'-5' exonuclease [Clostridia bacterium]|nr:3'-5' exonuclease [Clostridia bacterium]
MKDCYIAFDVETPNYANNRISAIGISVIQDGCISEEFYSLVNPETDFDPFNIRLTGIDEYKVWNAPTFLQLWERIEPLLSRGVLIAHNAPFDMGVLSKCIEAYEIEWKPYACYACTCAMGRSCYPHFYNHRLNTMCRYLNIELNHHDAAGDSRACALLLLNYLNHGMDIDGFIRKYDLINRRTLR